MAEAKKASTAKIIDVSHPGKTAPAPNSKSVIVGSRPIIKDPMFKPEPAGQEAESGKPTPKGRIKIEPLSAPELEDEKPAETKAEKKLTPTAKTIAELAEEASSKDKPSEPLEEQKDSSAEDVEEKVSDTESDDKTESDEKPAENENDNEDKDTEKQKSPSAAIEAEAAKQEKRSGAIQELIEGKKYYLPINSVEQRRSKRFVAVGILLSLFLVVAWVDIALDAGLIKLEGITPLTHFFSN